MACLIPLQQRLLTHSPAGFVMQVDAQRHPAQALQAPSAADPQDWVDKVARCRLQIEQLERLLEEKSEQTQQARSSEAECAVQLQLARNAQAEDAARCAALELTVSSQELQLRLFLSQSAADKSSFIQEKEQLQLLFDKQQQLCVSLTTQVVALTASCERLQREVDQHSLQRQHEKEQYSKEFEKKDAGIMLEQKKCLEAISRAQDLEAACNSAQSQLASMQASHLDQATRITSMAEQLQAASFQLTKHDHDALLNQVFTAVPQSLLFPPQLGLLPTSVYFRFFLDALAQELVLRRRTRGCQTIAEEDVERSLFESKADAATCALLQLRADCNQVLMQFTRDINADRAQVGCKR